MENFPTSCCCNTSQENSKNILNTKILVSKIKIFTDVNGGINNHNFHSETNQSAFSLCNKSHASEKKEITNTRTSNTTNLCLKFIISTYLWFHRHFTSPPPIRPPYSFQRNEW